MSTAADDMDSSDQVSPDVNLTLAEERDIREYWAVYTGIFEPMNQRLTEMLWDHPVWGSIFKSMSAEQLAAQNARSLELQRAAIVERAWRPYVDEMQSQGVVYAKMGISFIDWFELVSRYRFVAQPLVFAAVGDDPRRLAACLAGMSKTIDLAMAIIGEAYIGTKEAVIGKQQEAIRELSTPVLQVRDRLLMLPVIGILDTYRARQLTEQLLRSIRQTRAKAAVMDITGVPAVDSRVANHLLQTITAAKLMGTTVVVTGISSEVAQALVSLGVDLGKLSTVGDLQEGLEVAEKLLGLRLTAEVA